MVELSEDPSSKLVSAADLLYGSSLEAILTFLYDFFAADATAALVFVKVASCYSVNPLL